MTLTTQMPDGARYEIKIAVDDGYLFTVQQSVTERHRTSRCSVRPIGLVSRGEQIRTTPTLDQPCRADQRVRRQGRLRRQLEDLDERQAAEAFDNVSGWLGFTDKYWLTALVPGNAAMSADFRAIAERRLPGRLRARAGRSSRPARRVTTQTRLFAGAKEKAWLDRYEDAGIPKLSKSIDWGWFEFFMRPIFDLLMFLFHTIGNFGVAIICLTLIVRGIMFPIAQKQFQSMAAMRKVQPKMKAIQERFKDDKPRQQQEILKLYQAEKINPAAGCLPIVLQIPVFYALYKVLLVSVEMRHQPFVLWIKDLSAPDPLTPVNLFGLLHFTPPAFLAIGVLPILVGATQWMSMKLNPQPMDPAQAQIFAIMPWFLVFIMAPFAAGLQLYWMTNNC